MSRSHAFVVYLLLVTASTAAVSAQPTYTMTQIGRVPINGVGLTLIDDINDKGELTGGIQGVEFIHPFIWRSGEMTQLGNQSGQSPFAVLNDRLHVATHLFNPALGAEEAVLWRRGQISPLGSPSVVFAFTPVEINNRGIILGFVFDQVSFTFNTYLRDRSGAFELLDALPGASSMIPFDLNERGVAVGFSESIVGDRIVVQGVIWHDGAVERLRMPPGTELDFPRAINNCGQIAGEARINGATTGFVWDEGELTMLPGVDPAQDIFTAATDINNRGWIVGVSFSVDRQVAALWRDGVAYDLNTLISPDDPLKPFVTLSSAILINDRGFIVAGGIDSRRVGGEGSSFYLLRPARRK
jgi:probable HAF family extracellular repeat protein